MALASVATFLRATKTDDPYLEHLRPRVVLYVLWRFSWRASVAVCRAMLGILDRENKGREPAPLVGDRSALRGPSIGPGQVYRGTAIDLGLVPADTTPQEYEALAGNEALTLHWAVRVFRSKYDLAGGDLGKAIRLYNGSGPEADRYASEVVAWLAQTYGADPIGPRAGEGEAA